MVWRLFRIGDFGVVGPHGAAPRPDDLDRHLRHAFEQRALAGRTPEFEAERGRFGEWHRGDPQRPGEPAHANDVHGGHVAAVQAVRHAQQRRQATDSPTGRRVELCKIAVPRARGGGPPVEAGHMGDDHLFLGRNAEEVGVQDQVIRVLVVPLIVDVVPDVVQERRV